MVGLTLSFSTHPNDAFTRGETPPPSSSFVTSRTHQVNCSGSLMPCHQGFPPYLDVASPTSGGEGTKQLGRYLKGRDGNKQSRWVRPSGMPSVYIGTLPFFNKPKPLASALPAGPIMGCLIFPQLSTQMFWCVFQGVSNLILGLFALIYCLQPWFSF